MRSFDKILAVDPYLASKKLGFSEPTLQLLHSPKGHVGLSEKVASEASEWAHTVKPEKGKTFLLVLALGASEYYGPNRNGDGFRESELKKTYKTFETDAHLFKSHVNKDPAKAIGKVVRAFYNDKMHRVELIVRLDDSKAPDIARKIKSQEDVGVSMGCRIKFDVCSICGNEAANRAEYCKHAKFQMNEILSDGRVVYVDNPSPRFFDISVVWRPADRTGYMLKKVAREGYTARGAVESSAYAADKVAGLTVLAQAIQKAADMNKEVMGVGADIESLDDETEKKLHRKWLKQYAGKVVAGYEKISSSDIRSLARHDMPQVLATLSSMGIFLTSEEFLDLAFTRLTGSAAPKGLAKRLVNLQQDILVYLADNPEIVAQVLESGAVPVPGTIPPDAAIAEKVGKYMPSRSLNRDWMSKRAFIGSPELTYRDPRSGQLFRTDQEEVAATEKAELFGNSAALVGAAALGLVTYRAMAAAMGLKGAFGKLLSAGTGSLLGAKTYEALAGDGSALMTREGRPIPKQTLLAEVGSDDHPSNPARLLQSGAIAERSDRNKSWVLPTVLMADQMLSGGYRKTARVKFSSGDTPRSLNLEELSHTIGKVLTK